MKRFSIAGNLDAVADIMHEFLIEKPDQVFSSTYNDLNVVLSVEDEDASLFLDMCSERSIWVAWS